MKKVFLMLAVAAFSAQAISAQTVEGSENQDNWYVGIKAGASAKATGVSVFNNINPSAGIRVGRWFTPVFGLAVESDAYARTRGFGSYSTLVRALNTSVLGTTNFSNWFGGYKGEPRNFEVIGVYGLGWGHAFGTSNEREGQDNDVLTSKIGLDFAFNLGANKAWQLYIEPNLVYGLNAGGQDIKYNFGTAAFGVNVGLNYKFGNTNGTHNFKIAQLRDQAEIDGLNAKINELRAENANKDNKIAADGRTIADLQAQLAAEKSKQPEVKVVKENSTQLQPIVIFGQGKSTIDAAQYASIEMVAKYMRNHKNSKIIVRGYASPEGSAEINQKISIARANAVKNALVKRYKIAASRITTEGLGATDKLSEEVDFNRVAMFFDTTK